MTPQLAAAFRCKHVHGRGPLLSPSRRGLSANARHWLARCTGYPGNVCRAQLARQRAVRSHESGLSTDLPRCLCMAVAGSQQLYGATALSRDSSHSHGGYRKARRQRRPTHRGRSPAPLIHGTATPHPPLSLSLSDITRGGYPAYFVQGVYTPDGTAVKTLWRLAHGHADIDPFGLLHAHATLVRSGGVYFNLSTR